MQEGASEAKHTIAVLSPDYLGSGFCQAEWEAAFAQDPTGKKGALVPVRVRKCDPRGLLLRIVYIDLLGIGETAARNELLAGVGQDRATPTTAPTFPGITERSVPDKPDFPGALPPIWNVPHNRNPNFTGREKELAKIRDALAQGGTMALVQPIHGLGGVGKTQLALEYVYRHAAEYELVWWVRAEEPVTLAADYAALAGKLGLPEAGAEEQDAVVAAVRDSLARRNDWLLVFDNARDPEDIRGYLPPAGGRVLVTSRNPSWRRFGIPLPVKVMQPKEAVAFLLRRSGSEANRAARELADALGCLPLALAQAAAYVDESGASLSRYLELFRRRQTELLKRGKPGDYHDTVATTWDLAFQQVTEESAAAGELLQLCAFLAPDRIPLDMLTDGADSLPETVAAAVVDGIALDEAILVLRRLSLVERQDDSLSVHRLVQDVTRDRLPDAERVRWEACVAAMVGGAFPQDCEDVRTWEKCSRLLPHALTATDPSRREPDEVEETARLLNSLGVFLCVRAEYETAGPLLRRALAIREQALGPEHPDTLASVNSLGELLYNAGDYAGAKTLHRRALAVRERVLGTEHPDTLVSVSNLGELLYRSGDYTRAEPLHRRALETRERVLGPDHPDTLTSASNLGILLESTGDYAGAEPLYRRALAVNERVLGPDHPDTIGSVNNLGFLLFRTGDYTGAELLYRRALEASERVLGVEHPDTLVCVNYLGGLLSRTGDYAGAEPLFRRALAVRERVLGPEHPDTLVSVNNLGFLLSRMGDYAGAEPLLQRALATSERILGPEHPSTLGSVNNLGGLLCHMGNYAAAEPLLRRALAVRERVLGPEHPSTLVSLNNLAFLMVSTGDYTAAEPLLRRALAVRERVLGPEHPDTLVSVDYLTEFLSRTGDHTAAEPLMRRSVVAHRSLAKAMGGEHPEMQRAIRNYRRLLAEMGFRKSEIRKRVQEALEADPDAESSNDKAE
jgi:tetratricopeptide (TPR) repeat protein